MENLKPRDDPADTNNNNIQTRVGHPGDVCLPHTSRRTSRSLWCLWTSGKCLRVCVHVCDKVFRLHLWLMATGLETVSDD